MTLLASDVTNASDLTKNAIRSLIFSELVVLAGPGLLYPTVQSAIDAIGDASATKPYTVMAMPGVYDGGFTMKQYVSVEGAGRASIFNLTTASKIVVASDVTLSDMRINFDAEGSAGTGNQAGIEKPAGTAIYGLFFERLNIEVWAAGAAGDRYAAYFTANTVELTMRGCDILSRCGGVYMASSGYIRAHGNNIFMCGEDTPAAIGLNHYGFVLSSAARVYWYAGAITCGYNYATTPNPMEESTNIYAIYIPASNVNSATRFDVQSAWIYANNQWSDNGGAGDPFTGNLQAVRADNGWVRLKAVQAQAENPNYRKDGSTFNTRAVYGAWNTADDPGTGQHGKVQTSGCQISGVEGNVAGIEMTLTAAATLDAADTGGIILLDTTGGAFTVTMSTEARGLGQELNFAHIAGANDVTLDSGGSPVFGPEGTTTVAITPTDTRGIRRMQSGDWATLYTGTT